MRACSIFSLTSFGPSTSAVSFFRGSPATRLSGFVWSVGPRGTGGGGTQPASRMTDVMKRKTETFFMYLFLVHRWISIRATAACSINNDHPAILQEVAFAAQVAKSAGISLRDHHVGSG